jgi:hypothetical protein
VKSHAIFVPFPPLPPQILTIIVPPGPASRT